MITSRSLSLFSRIPTAGLFNRSKNYRSYLTDSSPTVKVLVTGAAGQIGYSVLQPIARGEMCGPKTKVEINMLDVEKAMDVMKGVKMELEDCSYPTLAGVNLFTDPAEALKDIDYAILLANKMVLTADIKRVDLLASNKDLYTEMGELFDKHAKPDAKALVIANPCNTNCLVMIKSAKNRSPKSFTSLSRLDHNRLRTFIAKKLDVNNDLVSNVIVWGNHASSMHPDIRFAKVKRSHDIYAVAEDVLPQIEVNWIQDTLLHKVKERAFEVIRARGKSSALSAGSSGVDHIRDWYSGTRDGDWVSMGVYSDGSLYGIPKDIVFSMPCVCYEKNYSIITDLPYTEIKDELKHTIDDLLEEKKLAGM